MQTIPPPFSKLIFKFEKNRYFQPTLLSSFECYPRICTFVFGFLRYYKFSRMVCSIYDMELCTLMNAANVRVHSIKMNKCWNITGEQTSDQICRDMKIMFVFIIKKVFAFLRPKRYRRILWLWRLLCRWL